MSGQVTGNPVTREREWTTHRPKVAIVQDALPYRGGAEKVLEAALEVFPEAPVYTLIYREKTFRGTPVADRTVHTSFINHLPGAQSHHRAYLPLMPLAVEQFDLRGYDVIISFSYAVAHGILPQPNQLHIGYIHTPMRHAWQRYHQTLQELNGATFLSRWAFALYMHAFRLWDAAAAARVDHIMTDSEWMAGCIWRAYRRAADVLYPPVDTTAYQPVFPRQNYYVVVSRLVPHKRIDLIVQAFNGLGLPLIVIGSGPGMGSLRKIAGPTVELAGWQPEENVRQLVGTARGFVHAAEEDFGIAMAEAQSAGCPVIAFRRGAAAEIVQPGVTGRLFAEQTADCLASAVADFEGEAGEYDPATIRKHALRFDRARFCDGLRWLVAEDWRRFHDQPFTQRVPGGELFSRSANDIDIESGEITVDGYDPHRF